MTISYLVPRSKNGASHVQLQIYDASGRIIKTSVDKQMGPGFHTEYWDGTDESGKILPNGIYFYRLRVEKQIKIRKAVLVR